MVFINEWLTPAMSSPSLTRSTSFLSVINLHFVDFDQRSIAVVAGW
jgi:hypothetical protein